jgi:outer membrane protein assembly factor BamB
MTRKLTFRAAVLIAAAIASSSCNIFRKGKAKTPVLGERIAILANESDAVIDPDTARLPMTLPPATLNTDWAQSGASADKSGGHFELGQQLTEAWVVKAGRGNTVGRRISSPPIVANGRVYVLDSLGAVRSYDANSGALNWESQTPDDKRDEHSLYGGGLAYDQGHIYAVNGLGYVSQLDEVSGGIVWQVRPGGPLRGSPTIADGTIYVMSEDSRIYALDQADGKTKWNAAGALEIAGVFGSASPAAARGTVVAGFASGELNAYRYENGRQVWQDALQRTSVRTSVSSLNDVDANPVIDGGQVFAIGAGGRMVGLELNSGQRQWEVNVAGISSPWLAGDWLFVVTDDARLICVNRSSGHVRWINQLPEYRKPKSKKGEIDYKGPVLAGGRLIVVGSNGVIVNIDPDSGSFQSQSRINGGVSQTPVVANRTLYIYDDDGNLHALR